MVMVNRVSAAAVTYTYRNHDTKSQRKRFINFVYEAQFNTQQIAGLSVHSDSIHGSKSAMVIN